MRASFAVAVVLLSALPSLAGAPPLEDTALDGLSVGMPKGWTVKTQSQKGTQMFMAQRPPGGASDPAVVVSVTPEGATATEDQLSAVILSQLGKTPKLVKRETLKSGGQVLIADGWAGAVAVRLGAVVVSQGGHALTVTLIATPADFETLGGIDLVVATVASIKAAQNPPAAKQQKPQAKPAPAAK